jgi:hypothetical protein
VASSAGGRIEAGGAARGFATGAFDGERAAAAVGLVGRRQLQVASSDGGSVEACDTAGGLTARWVACTAASGWCGRRPRRVASAAWRTASRCLTSRSRRSYQSTDLQVSHLCAPATFERQVVSVACGPTAALFAGSCRGLRGRPDRHGGSQRFSLLLV